MSIAEKYYTDTAAVSIYSGMNSKGDTVFEPEVTVRCRFERIQKETVDRKGHNVVSSAVMLCGVFIPALSVVKHGQNERFTVISCEPVRRISGEIDHYEVMI